jgi:hypothetical protein
MASLVIVMSEAQAEAYVRKKPKRIIQNQTLIELLGVVCAVAPLPITWATFLLVFGFYPQIVVPAILAVWIFGAVTFLALRAHVERQNRKR